MHSGIKKIYDLLNSPILTPYNSLENAKLDNYSYVNYYKGKIGIICEIQCINSEQEEAKYYYFFDSNDYLFKVNMQIVGAEKLEVFNCESELQNRVRKYYNQLPSNNTAG